MFYISHRGNIFEKKPDKENHPDYILDVCRLGYTCEVDVWKLDGKYSLGHDKPQYEISLDWMKTYSNYLIVHAKSIVAIPELMSNYIHCFFHDKDDCTITSLGYIWTYPGKELTEISIDVMPEMVENGIFEKKNIQYAGICSDVIGRIHTPRYKNEIK